MYSRIAMPTLVVVLALGSVMEGQQLRPHDTVMREVSATFRSLNASLDSGELPDAAASADRLTDLFGEIEAFWAMFETQDAIELARTAQSASLELVAAAGEEDLEAARRAYSAIQGTCGSCHDSHRESLPDGSFRIKP